MAEHLFQNLSEDERRVPILYLRFTGIKFKSQFLYKVLHNDGPFLTKETNSKTGSTLSISTWDKNFYKPFPFLVMT